MSVPFWDQTVKGHECTDTSGNIDFFFSPQLQIFVGVFDLRIDFLHQHRLQHPAAGSFASTGLIKRAALYS